MPATVLVVVIPEVPPTFGANELGDHIFANHSTFGQDALVAGSDLIDTVFASVSTFGLDRLVESAFPDVSLIDAIFSNVSTFGADTLSAAPPGEILRDTVLTNVSTFGADTLAEAPPNEILRDTVLTNVSTFGADELVSIGGLLVAAGAGSFALTGTDATLHKGYSVAAGAGGFALTGTAATPRTGHGTTAGAGSYALTGTAASTRHAARAAAGAGSFALTGSAATLTIRGTDTWDPAFASAKFTLSNADLTATATQQNVVDTIIGKTSHSTGKWYFEMSGFNSTGHDLAWGLATSSQSNASQLWNTGVAFRNNRNWQIGGTQTASGMSSGPAAGTVLGFAVDLDADRIYLRDVNVSTTAWFGNGSGADPVAGTGGFDISTRDGLALFLAFTSNQNGANEPTTMNAGGSAFGATAPTGYTAWQG